MEIRSRLLRRFQLLLSTYLARRRVFLDHGFPVISFTFDDFPKSAFVRGGEILARYDVLGTYYASLGLMDKNSPVGLIFSAPDLIELSRVGHELGCHTFSHCNSWKVTKAEFESSVLANECALTKLLPASRFETLAYPYGCCSPRAKRIAGKYFVCARGGRHGLNVNWVDLNDLRSVALERIGNDGHTAKELIDYNQRACGWLILRTHDTTEQPGTFGCTLDLLEDVVRYAVQSGARILPVARAWRMIHSGLQEKLGRNPLSLPATQG